MMTDGHRDNSVGERKLILDEENRLLSVDDNGFVSNYWYDADGERTVKSSSESDQVYVNGVFSGGSTNTAKFSLYVSPYLVANSSRMPMWIATDSLQEDNNATSSYTYTFNNLVKYTDPDLRL